MKITPGAAVIGIAVGSVIAQTVTVMYLWVTVQAHYYADEWTLYAIEQYPLWLMTITHVLLAIPGSLLPALVVVPVLRRRPSLQQLPASIAVVFGGVAIACIPFTVLGMLPTVGVFVTTVLVGSALAVGIAAFAAAVVRRRAVREAEQLRAAFADDRP